MTKKFKLISALSLIVTAILSVLYAVTSYEFLLTLSITFGTVAYHLIMRLFVGFIFNCTMKNKANYTKRWYRVSEAEIKIYEKLKIKKLTRKIHSYDSSVFDKTTHTWGEIAEAMCQAELVHETIAVLSSLPIGAGAFFGAYPVFIVTSVLAASFDLMLAIVQRYNRQRIINRIKREQN